jgi:hypothetical protein
MQVQDPVPGYWYANEFGQLTQVRAVLYQDGEPQRVMVEYINSRRDLFGIDVWSRLGLCLHSPGLQRRRRGRRGRQAD